jgi:hypothetical protein
MRSLLHNSPIEEVSLNGIRSIHIRWFGLDQIIVRTGILWWLPDLGPMGHDSPRQTLILVLDQRICDHHLMSRKGIPSPNHSRPFTDPRYTVVFSTLVIPSVVARRGCGGGGPLEHMPNGAPVHPINR